MLWPSSCASVWLERQPSAVTLKGMSCDSGPLLYIRYAMPQYSPSTRTIATMSAPMVSRNACTQSS